MRHALLTSTTYGTWLPGDPRGSVTSVRDLRVTDPITPFRVEHDRPGEPWETAIPGLVASARHRLKCPPVFLSPPAARVVIEQFRETSAIRGWQLEAVSVMRNHFHAVLGFAGYWDVDRILVDLKAYASRGLNEQAGGKQKWWTRDGSKRMLPDDRAVAAAVNYVLHKQPYPLARWSRTEGYLEIP